MKRMKRVLLAGVSLVALMAAWGPASAAAVVFLHTGAIANYMIPVEGEYQILAYGAQGAGAQFAAGGGGALVRGDFSFPQGYQLQIAVGGPGGLGNGDKVGGGGGGGSFVIGLPGTRKPQPPIIAGGGGGGGGGGSRRGPAAPAQ